MLKQREQFSGIPSGNRGRKNEVKHLIKTEKLCMCWKNEKLIIHFFSSYFHFYLFTRPYFLFVTCYQMLIRFVLKLKLNTLWQKHLPSDSTYTLLPLLLSILISCFNELLSKKQHQCFSDICKIEAFLFFFRSFSVFALQISSFTSYFWEKCENIVKAKEKWIKRSYIRKQLKNIHVYVCGYGIQPATYVNII